MSNHEIGCSRGRLSRTAKAYRRVSLIILGTVKLVNLTASIQRIYRASTMLDKGLLFS